MIGCKVKYEEDISVFFGETNWVEKVRVFYSAKEAEEFVRNLMDNPNIMDVRILPLD